MESTTVSKEVKICGFIKAGNDIHNIALNHEEVFVDERIKEIMFLSDLEDNVETIFGFEEYDIIERGSEDPISSLARELLAASGELEAILFLGDGAMLYVTDSYTFTGYILKDGVRTEFKEELQHSEYDLDEMEYDSRLF